MKRSPARLDYGFDVHDVVVTPEKKLAQVEDIRLIDGYMRAELRYMHDTLRQVTLKCCDLRLHSRWRKPR